LVTEIRRKKGPASGDNGLGCQTPNSIFPSLRQPD
jgi:hypothetical protein